MVIRLLSRLKDPISREFISLLYEISHNSLARQIARERPETTFALTTLPSSSEISGLRVRKNAGLRKLPGTSLHLRCQSSRHAIRKIFNLLRVRIPRSNSGFRPRRNE